MAFLKQYLLAHKKHIILPALFTAVFAAVFSLYDLETEAVWYAALLCLIPALAVAVWSYLRAYSAHVRLRGMETYSAVSPEELPEPGTVERQDYHALLTAIYRQKFAQETEYAARYQDMMDYYTMWAHQIKTPIAAMRLLLQGEDSELSGDLLEQLFKTEQYVEMVLQYLRMEDMSADLRIEHYSLDGIVRQAVHKYAKLFIRKKIKLVFEGLDCMVLTDEKWLVFVIEQLLSNALKYTRTGSITIKMDAAAPKTLVIADTGIGIEAEDLPRVCEKGYTGYNGRTDKKSTGIGLYLCKRILTRLSHTLSIKSEPGKGTTVKIGLDMLDLPAE